MPIGRARALKTSFSGVQILPCKKEKKLLDLQITDE